MGEIITFYSYKGGTGRTMALANVAWILASRGKKVLAVDWDLEAPGLHIYFRPFLQDRDLTSPPGGVIDLVTEFAIEGTASKEIAESDGEWYLRFADIRRYASSLNWDFPKNGTIDFVASGRQGPSYAARVAYFDWNSFYTQMGGGVFLEAVREDMRQNYDFILVDSRTGVSDAGGVCTIHLPDTLVVCFTMNNQSIDGAVAVAESIVKQREKDFCIFPVPNRVEFGETEKLERRRDYARRKFEAFLNHLPNHKHNVYWGDIEVPYRAFYAYEEILAVFGDRPQVPGSLLSSFERLTRYLSRGAVRSLAPVLKNQREAFLAAFEREHESVDSHEEKFAYDVAATRLWAVPLQRNPFFTGREEALEDLRGALTEGTTACQIQVICGLGGIGKSQVAAEYAYRYSDDYQTVFWIRADDEAEIKRGFSAIAGLLDLPEASLDDQDSIVRAVKLWLEENSDWLLIFVNADRPESLPDFLPKTRRGHIILTSRSQALGSLGVIKPINLDSLPAEDAVSFLLKRTGRTVIEPAEREAAATLAEELGRLPLALEQAGAFLAETQASFRDYLKSFRRRGLELLSRSNPAFGEAPELVSTVWSLNFEEVRNSSEASADLLRASAFLSPHDIPFEILVKGRAELGPTLAVALAEAEEDSLVLVELFKPLTRYSLIKQDMELSTYSLHRLVQVVLRDRMNDESCRLWAQRAVRALNRVFPEIKFSNWPLCDRLLAHVHTAARFVVKFDLESQEAGRLMNEAALYSKIRARYDEAELLYDLSLRIFERSLGNEHSSVATALSNLAALYRTQGRLKEAEPLCRRALAISEKAHGLEHPMVADHLNNLAVLYMVEGRLEEAEPLCQRALEIKEQLLGPNHPAVADSLHNLAALYRRRDRLDDAEPIYQRALAIKEESLGSDHPSIGMTLSELADLYRVQGRYEEAEPLYQRDLLISEKALGPDHPDVGVTLNNLANLYVALGRIAEAEPLYVRAWEVSEKTLGGEHPEVATVLTNLADLHRVQGRIEEAESLYQRSLKILEFHHGSGHPSLVASLSSYAILLEESGREEEATALRSRARVIQ